MSCANHSHMHTYQQTPTTRPLQCNSNHMSNVPTISENAHHATCLPSKRYILNPHLTTCQTPTKNTQLHTQIQIYQHPPYCIVSLTHLKEIGALAPFDMTLLSNTSHTASSKANTPALTNIAPHTKPSTITLMR